MQPGDVVERYRVEAAIGRGATAVVYRVRHTTLGTLHALKVLEAADPELAARLVAEGRAQASLSHPNLVPVSDVLQVDGRPALLMSYVDGMDLGQLLRGAIPEGSVAVGLFRGIVAGVAAAHRAGLVHRDLKPANILLATTDAGVIPRVTDFGIATQLARPSGLTRDGQILGTPAYMAPEQLQGPSAIDARVDVWALGVILYELLCGVRPFPGGSPDEVLASIHRGPVDARGVVGDLSEPLAAALAGCLTVRAEDRIGDAEGLLEVLDGAPWPTASSGAGRGRVLGDFEILSEIGRGSSGQVYRARQQGLDRVVALKVVPASGDVAEARFLREVQALARVDHRHVVPVLAHGTAEGVLYVAMAYVSGADLARVGAALATTEGRTVGDLRRAGGIAPGPDDTASMLPFLARRFSEVASGLHALHRAGVLHRDIKPSNLILSEDGDRIVVVDLGLALIADASRPLTQRDVQILGTLRYMPPEQLQRNLLEIDPRADVYALGATLTELCTGRPFFDGDTEERLIHQVLNEDPPWPCHLDPSIPADLDRVLRRATAKRADDRYPDAAAFAADLAAFAAGAPVSVRTAGPIARLRRWIHLNPLPVAVLITLGATLLAGGTLAGCSAAAFWYAVRPTTKLYADWVPRNGGYAGYRWMATYAPSAGPHVRVTRRSGLPVRLERRDGSGRLEGPIPILEQVFDQDGRVIRVVHRDRDEQIVFIEAVSWGTEAGAPITTRRFSTPDGSPIPHPQSAVEVIVDRLDGEGYAIDRRHLASDGTTPRPDREGSYGLQIQRDRWGRVVERTWIDADGRPTSNRDGIAIERLIWPEEAPWAYIEPDRRLYDAAGDPTTDAHGVHWVDHEYDCAWWRLPSGGCPMSRVYRGLLDQPVVGSDGTAWEHRWIAFFRSMDLRFAGPDGHPAPGPGGVFGQVDRPGDQWPNAKGRRYLGPDGQPFTHEDGYAIRVDGPDGIRRFFDPEGQPVARDSGAVAYRLGRGRFTCLGPDDIPIRCKSGWSERIRTYDDHGEILTEALYDETGQPMIAPGDHAARIETPRDGSGRVLEHRRLGPDGALVRAPGRPARDLHRYDASGRLLSRTVLDDQDRPVDCPDGYHQERIGYDAWGREVSRRYLDRDGAPVVSAEAGYARRTLAYDAFGRRIALQTFDADDRPLLVDGCATVRWVRDRYGREVERSCLGADGGPAPGIDGATGRRRAYGPTGRVVLTEWIDAEGEASHRTDGASAIRTERDALGRPIRTTRLGADAIPMDGPDGYATTEIRYDAAGRIAEHRHLAASGRPAGRIVYRRDPQHRVTEEVHHGPDDAVVRRVARGYDPRGRLDAVRHAGPDGDPIAAPRGDPDVPEGWGSWQRRVEALIEEDTWRGLDGSILAVRIRRYDDRKRLVEQRWSGPAIPADVAPTILRTYDTDGRPVERVAGGQP